MFQKLTFFTTILLAMTLLVSSVASSSIENDAFCRDEHARQNETEHRAHHFTCHECQTHGQISWTLSNTSVAKLAMPVPLLSSRQTKTVIWASRFISSIFRPPIA